jgi:hypothetical protein
MKNFTVYDSTGRALRAGACPDEDFALQAGPGETIVEGWDLPPEPQLPTSATPPSYVRERRRAYPSVEQQLDWLWHAMHDGAMTAIEPFYSQLLAVKTKYPKSIDPVDLGATEVL